ncbi:hypothetical protein FB45DRAFT_1039687 [Roridomyces roridus]|uniref:Uncharacterized protein n=1 Tax=Roridomyces roridus TaxID=1738132 RepID=A0AAD7B221_9AGAR|nr:hypothetical protein FB45DRAFT_1039687 [Roridomyces roridus]
MCADITLEWEWAVYISDDLIDMLQPDLRRLIIHVVGGQDGTLVLATTTSLFQVYGDLLAREATIFRNMLEMPQPADGETVDGCPDDGADVE